MPDITNVATNTPLSDCSWTQTHSHLVYKETLDHFGKHLTSLAKWLIECSFTN